MIWWLLYLQCCTIITNTGASIQTKTFYQLEVTPHSLLLLWHPLNCFLPQWICLLGIFHINGVIHYMVLCIWLLLLRKMFSRVIYMLVQHTSEHFFFFFTLTTLLKLHISRLISSWLSLLHIFKIIVDL